MLENVLSNMYVGKQYVKKKIRLMKENFIFGIGSNLTIPCDSLQGNDDDCSSIVTTSLLYHDLFRCTISF